MESRESKARSIHPLVAAAAVSVTALSLAGVGAITGLIPSPLARSAPVDPLAPAPAATAGTMPAAAAASTGAPMAAVSPLSAEPAPAQAANPSAAGSAATAHGSAAASDRGVSNTGAQGSRPAPRPVVRAPRAEPPPPAAPRHDTTPAATQVAAAPIAAAPVVQPVVDPSQATVLSIDRIEEKAAQGSGVGAIGGGVLGGVLGNQVGGGNGRKAMTVIGAIGGAVAGNEIEKRARSTEHYDVKVRMADGSTRVIRYDTPPAFQTGDRIRVGAS